MEAAKKFNDSRRLAPVKGIQTTPGYECFSESSVRHLIYGSEDRVASNGDVIKGNGLGPAIIRIGRRVLIDLDEFDRWIDSHRQQRPEETLLTEQCSDEEIQDGSS